MTVVVKHLLTSSSKNAQGILMVIKGTVMKLVC